MPHTEKHEVLVVGAGPCGSIAAMALARQGHEVLMIDKAGFPRDKICGDGVLNHVMAMLCDLGMKEKLPGPWFHPMRGSKVVTVHGVTMEYRAGWSGYTVPRLQFDALLQSHAVERGAVFLHAKAVAPLVEGGRVAGVTAIRNGKAIALRASATVVADGANSVIARQLVPPNRARMDISMAIRAYVENFDIIPHTGEFYVLPGPVLGYAWIFPLGNGRANVGLGMPTGDLRKPGKSMKKLLDEFLARPELIARRRPGFKVHSPGAWPLPFASSRGIQRTLDGAVLTGDAGAFIDPMNGGGLLSGAVSARIAADVIHDALTAGDVSRKFLGEFDRRCAPLVREMQAGGLAVNVCRRIPFSWDILMLAGARNHRAQDWIADRFVKRSSLYNRVCPVSEPYRHVEPPAAHRAGLMPAPRERAVSGPSSA